LSIAIININTETLKANFRAQQPSIKLINKGKDIDLVEAAPLAPRKAAAVDIALRKLLLREGMKL
jgi:hypothetical protein